MMMRKLSAAVAATALSLTLFAGAAFAEEPAPTTPPAASAPAPAAEWEAPLKAKMETIVQLRTQIDGLQAQLKTQSQANEDLRKQLKDAIAGAVGQQIKDLEAQLKAAYAANVTPLKEQIKPLEEQFQAAKAAKDSVQMMLLRARMAELKLKIAAEVAKLQPLRDQLAPLKEQVKEKKAAVEAIQAQVQPLIDQEKALHAKDQELVEQGKAAMTAVETAMKAGDWNAMLSGLDTVISLKQQGIANLQQISSLKTQINGMLTTALAAQH